MTPGLSEDLLEVNDAHKTAMINNELRRLQMDIVALQETRLPATGNIREKDFTFFWQGKPPEEVREHGVGFAIRNRLLGSIVPPMEGSARIIKLKLHTAAGMVSLIHAYDTTLTSSNEAKDKFYDDLGLALRDIPQQEPVFLLGDFNARVGYDHSSWHSCLGQFGFGKMDESGPRLLEFCCRHDLCITNSFFDTKPLHKVSWRHPRSKHWHQLDLVLTGRSNLRNVKLTRSFQSADCDTDHSLAVCRNLPSERNLQALCTARSIVQQTARRCANDYWVRLCSSIQTAATVGNIRGMYEGIKQATGIHKTGRLL
ncbi:craniofacial development protein 2-like [Procambarus clarkii]|uniref:craniofacial development protein 2-like n=1 Tax=Procambarus clarkii TaxID=6728 RepID=UPI003743E2AC